MNCKLGDLAIVIGALSTPENIGRIVEVIDIAAPGESFFMTDGMEVELRPTTPGPIWRARGTPPLMWRVSGFIAYAREIAISDDCLRPVSGMRLDEEIRDEVLA